MRLSFFIFLLFPLAALSQENYIETILGGDNINGNIFRKRYPTQDDLYIKYQQWNGYVVFSNEQLDKLYQIDPDTEAIKFEYRRNDGVDENYFPLTETIGKFKNLKYLHINSNRINTYPANIANLVNLEEIILQLRNKTSIEFEFHQFNNLKHLTIDFADNMEEFPLSIFQLNQLQTLKLFRFFSLKDNLLAGLENLNQLEELFIWDSNLRLPSNFKANNELKTLILDRYRTSLPSGIYGESLKTLVLNGLYDSLSLDLVSQCKDLETLFLMYQKQFIGQLELPKLEHLTVSGYKGETIDFDITKLPSIESIWIGGCSNIKSVANISTPTLKSIWINGNESLQEIKFEAGKLTNLMEVKMINNKSLDLGIDSINGVEIQKKIRSSY